MAWTTSGVHHGCEYEPRPVAWTTFGVHHGCWWGEQLLVVQRESPKWWWETEVKAGSEE